MSWRTARGYGWARALRLLGARPGVAALSVACAALALTLPLFVLVLAQVLTPYAGRLPAAEATAFVATGTATGELKALAARIEATAGVAAVRLITRDSALAELQKRAGGALADLKSNPLPDVLVAQFAPGTPAAAVDAAVAAIRKQPKVEAVVADLDWYRRLEALSGAVSGIAVGVAAAMLLLVIAIVLGAVRLLAAASSAELRVLELVGADPAFVRRPYVYAGAAVLAAAATLSLALLAAARWALAPALGELGQTWGVDLTLPWPPWPLIAAYLSAATLLGGAAAAVGLDKRCRAPG